MLAFPVPDFGWRSLPWCEDCADQVAQAAAPLLEDSVQLSIAATAYRHVEGKWPHSTHDLEAFDEESDFGICWQELHGRLVFEELPDGRLRITPVDARCRITVTVDVPADPVEN